MEPPTDDTRNTFIIPQPITEQYARILVTEIDDAAGYPTSSNVVDEFRKSIQDGIAIGSITVADMSVFPEWTGPRYYIIDGIHRLRAYLAEGISEIDVKVYLFARSQDALIHRLRACLHKPDEVLYVRALRGLAELVTERLAGRMHEIHLLEPLIDETGAWQAVPRRDTFSRDAAHLAFAFDDHIFALQMTGQAPTTTWERLLTDTLDEVARVVGKSREWLRNEAMARYVLFPDGDIRGQRKRVLPVIAEIRDRGLRERVMARWLRERVGVSYLEDAIAYLGLNKREAWRDDWVPRRERSWIVSKLNQSTLTQLAYQYEQDERAYQQRRIAKAQIVSHPTPETPVTPLTSPAVFAVAAPRFVAPVAPQPTVIAKPAVTPHTHVQPTPAPQRPQVQAQAIPATTPAHEAVTQLLAACDGDMVMLAKAIRQVVSLEQWNAFIDALINEEG